MISKQKRDKLRDQVIEECRPGGHPTQTYLDLDLINKLTSDEAAALTTAIWLNLEDRLRAIEQELGIDIPAPQAHPDPANR